MYLPDDWRSAGDPMEIERCPLCEAQFLRTDDDCPGCGQSLCIAPGNVSHT
jgi:hypothetical protein